MELIDTPPTPAFDASAFTTYDNETDSTPTEQELVEELPAHLMPPPIDTENVKPTFRRGTGYLRAETVPEETADAEPVGEDSFGAGLESAENETPTVPAMRQTDGVGESGDSTESTGEAESESSERQGTGRKRRRRRRRKPRGARAAESAETGAGDSLSDNSNNPGEAGKSSESPPPVSEVSAPSNVAPDSAPAGATEASPEGESADAKEPGDKEESGTPPKRKRRRRRRRGK